MAVLSTEAPRRPALRYHGGKWRLAPKIIAHFPAHRVYVEPYGGGASVLLRKERSYAEIYNDLDGEIVNLFCCYRDCGAELMRLVELTPFAREEFAEAYIPVPDKMEMARRTLVRSFMGFGSAAATDWKTKSGKARGGVPNTGFRARSNRSGTTPAHDWANFPENMRLVIARLQGIVIEQRPAMEVCAQHDGPETLHYLDPPYAFEARDSGTDYRFEMTTDDHRAMATTAKKFEGFVIISGYQCLLYKELFDEWKRVEIRAFADGARPRVECLWFNPMAWAARPQRELFVGG